MEADRAHGIIDILSSGFATVARKLWLVLIPVALDLLFWLGPRLSIAPLVRDLSYMFATPPGSAPEYAQTIREVGRLLRESGESFNLLTTLSSSLLGVPSLGSLESSPAGVATASTIGEIASMGTFIGTFLLLSAAGLLIGCIYLNLVAWQFRDDHLGPRGVLSRLWVSWVRIVAIVALGTIASVVAALPLSLVLALTAIISPQVASLVMGLGWVVAFWLGLYFFFVPRAIVLSDAGVWESVRLSFRLVRKNFWSTLGLIILIYVISAGLSLVWQTLRGNPLLTVVSIIGNAFVGTGLLAATFIFYQDRYMAQLESVEQTGSA